MDNNFTSQEQSFINSIKPEGLQAGPDEPELAKAFAELDAIGNKYRAGEISAEEQKIQLDEVRRRFREKLGVP